MHTPYLYVKDQKRARIITNRTLITPKTSKIISRRAPTHPQPRINTRKLQLSKKIPVQCSFQDKCWSQTTKRTVTPRTSFSPRPNIFHSPSKHDWKPAQPPCPDERKAPAGSSRVISISTSRAMHFRPSCVQPPSARCGPGCKSKRLPGRDNTRRRSLSLSLLPRRVCKFSN